MADLIPTQVTQQQVGFAPEVAPYAQDLLGRAQALTDFTQFPYQQYMGERFAQFSPLQQQAYAGAQAMQAAPQLADASAMAGQAGLRALGYGQYAPSQFGNFYQAVPSYQPTSFTAPGVTSAQLQSYQMGPAERVSAQQVGTPLMSTAQTAYAPNLQTYQMGPAERIRTQSFARPGAAQQFMSPYMQNVVERQQQAAQREADIQRQTLGAQFAQAGAFGGGRFGVQQGRMAEALARQKGDIQAQGLQSAFQQAQQQFNTEQQARLAAQQANQQAGLQVGAQNLAAQLGVQQLGAQTGLQTSLANLSAAQQANVQNQAAQLQAQGLNAQQAMQAALANQQAGLTVGQQNLAAQLGVQQLGSQQGLQAALANQQAQMQAQQQAEQSRQYGYGQLMQQAGLGAQYGQAAAQLGEQSRQYGAGLGLQGIQTGLQAAGQLGQLGSTQFGQNMAINQLLGQYGGQQQQRTQDILNSQYQDFLNYQNYPYKQLGFMSDIIRGVPLMQTGANVYQQPPSTLGTLAGLGLGAYGLMKKEGGTVSSYAEGGTVGMAYGGDVTSDNYVEGAIKRLSNAQLQQALKNALDRRDVRQAEMLQDELRERAEAASYSRGIAGAAPQNMEEMLPSEESMRRGGIVSFAEPTEENNRSLVTDEEAVDEGGGGGSALRKDISSVFDYIKGKLRPSSGVEYEKTVAPIRSKTGPLSYMFGDAEEYRKAKVARDWAAENEERLRNDPELMAKFKADPYYTATTGTGSGRGSPAAYQKYDAKEAAAFLAREGKPAPAPAAPKGGKKADPAVAVGNAMAQVTGNSPEDEIAKARKYMDFFKSEDEPMYKAMQEQIDDIKSKSKEIGERRTRDALSAFGFKMAAAASQVGAGSGLSGALRAAGAAAPTITESVKESDKMQREYDRLSKQMQVAMLQSKVAASRGDKQTALGLIKAAEQADLQRQTLAETIRSNKERAAILRGRAAAGNTALERAYQQSRTAIARDAMKQANKDWNDMLLGPKLRKQYPSRQAYEKELYDSAWSKAMPQLQYLGTLGGQSED